MSTLHSAAHSGAAGRTSRAVRASRRIMADLRSADGQAIDAGTARRFLQGDRRYRCHAKDQRARTGPPAYHGLAVYRRKTMRSIDLLRTLFATYASASCGVAE